MKLRIVLGPTNLKLSFFKALEIAVEKEKVDADLQEQLLVQFHLRTGETLAKESFTTLARNQIINARSVSPYYTDIFYNNYHECLKKVFIEGSLLI